MKEADIFIELLENKRINKHVFLWGIGKKTKELITDITESGKIAVRNIAEEHPVDERVRIEGIIDNYKCDFMTDYLGVPIYPASRLDKFDKDDISILLAVATSGSIWKQLDAMGIKSVYNLSDIEDIYTPKRCDFPYSFIDRSNGDEACVYVLAGYQKEIWDTTLQRMFTFMEPGFDYCMISSGKYDEELDALCEKHGWSYLYSEHNQICFLQNLIVELHPSSKYFIKLDEDMFIGKGFYSGLLKGYEKAERTGEYRVGCAVPVMPLNFNSYITYLNTIGKLEDFEKKFGRAYRCTFSAPYSMQEAALWIWDTVDSIDGMSDFFFENDAPPRPLCSLYNIGAFLYSRDRWVMLGRWPEDPRESGMGVDEAYIFHENMDSGMATYEIGNVFAGHFAFTGQKEMMLEYYKKNHKKFEIRE